MVFSMNPPREAGPVAGPEQSFHELVMRQLNPRGAPVPSPFPARILRRGQHLYRPGDTPACVYSVNRGALKTYNLSHDGGEWIGGFHFPGEVLGLDALLERPARRGAVALETVKVSVIPVSSLLESLGRSEALRLRLLERFGDEIGRLEEHLSLDALNAEQRLAAFVLWVVDRFADGTEQPTMRLPMSHKDIGNYLRLVPETMSRLLARFQERQWLSVRRRDITVRNLDELRKAASQQIRGSGSSSSSSSTRSPPNEVASTTSLAASTTSPITAAPGA